MDSERRAAAMISVCLGFFVIQLDVTIVNVALPAIQREIGGSLAGLQWVIDAYTVALASIMLTAGSAADRIGARRVFALGLTMFAIGSAACAAAPVLGALLAAGILAIICFVRAERRQPSPMLPLSMSARGTSAAPPASAWCST
jgi:MFS transporter, DHA2 family, methylenomycin A resistance protein